MKTSLMISTYNKIETLKVSLESVLLQKQMPDEIVIADDGSREGTKIFIDEIRGKFKIPIVHVWQKDEGFQLGRIRNKAVIAASGEYIIQIDGDVFLHPNFISDHIKLAKEKCYIKGGRVNLNKKLSEQICSKGHPIYKKFYQCGIESKPENGIYIPLLASFLADRYRKKKSPALGTNMSFWKTDFIAVNGYDEFFEGWGGEDIELGERFLSYGCKKKYLKFSGIIYHLWHEDKYMYNKRKNKDYAYDKIKSKSTWCTNGVDKYLNDEQYFNECTKIYK